MKNVFYYCFVISLFLHIAFLAFGSILSKSREEFQFQDITMVSISEDLKQENYEEKEEIIKKENIAGKEIIEKKILPQEEIFQKPFSPFAEEKPKQQASGGGAEIITSISDDLLQGTSSGDNFVVQNLQKGEGEGIGLGGKGSGMGIGEDEKGDGVSFESYIPRNKDEKPEIDKEKILRDYIIKVLEKVEKNKKYPEFAKQENIEGIVEVKFSITKFGKIKEVNMISSSGYKILDDAAILTVKRASPFQSIPKELEKEELNIKVKIVFKLQ